jgi:hypothetical protein
VLQYEKKQCYRSLIYFHYALADFVLKLSLSHVKTTSAYGLKFIFLVVIRLCRLATHFKSPKLQVLPMLWRRCQMVRSSSMSLQLTFPFVASPLEEDREGAAAPCTHCFLPLFLNLPSMMRRVCNLLISDYSLFCFGHVLWIWHGSKHRSRKGILFSNASI